MQTATKYFSLPRIVLADGTVLDTGNEASKAEFTGKKPDFIKTIETLRDKIRGDEQLANRIRYKIFH